MLVRIYKQLSPERNIWFGKNYTVAMSFNLKQGANCRRLCVHASGASATASYIAKCMKFSKYKIFVDDSKTTKSIKI